MEPLHFASEVIATNNLNIIVLVLVGVILVMNSRSNAKTLASYTDQMKETREFMKDREESHDEQVTKMMDDQRKDSERWRDTFTKFEVTMNGLAKSNNEMAESNRVLAVVIENKISEGGERVFDRRGKR